LQACAERGFRIVRAAARQVLRVEHRPAEGAVDKQIGIAADDEILRRRELADAQVHLAGQILFDPEIEQPDRRRRFDAAHQHQIVEIGAAELRAEDAVDAGVDFCSRPASELFEVAFHDDAEAAVIAGALFDAAGRVVEGVAVIAEDEG
jgi:hypothetical protein